MLMEHDLVEPDQVLELSAHEGTSVLSAQASLMVKTKDIARLKLIITDLERKVTSRLVRR